MSLKNPQGAVVAFTGHRPEKLGGYKIPNLTQKLLRLALLDDLIRLRPRHAFSGMALGFDTWAAMACIDLDIPFTAAIPCDGQDSQWPDHSRMIYHIVLAKAATVVVISPGPYAAWKMQKRNEYMVDNCEILIAAYDGTPGGTQNCIKYATKVERNVRYLEWVLQEDREF